MNKTPGEKSHSKKIRSEGPRSEETRIEEPGPSPEISKAAAQAASSIRATGLAQSPDNDTPNARPVVARPIVVAIANQKGGVAKTTSVVSLGGALVRHEQDVLLVDLDAQANLTLALGKDPNRLRASVSEVLFSSATLLSVSRETDIPGLDLVPANSGLQLAERFLPNRTNHEWILYQAIYGSGGLTAPPDSAQTSSSVPQTPSLVPVFDVTPTSLPLEQGFSQFNQPVEAGQIYDFILLDCPPAMGAVTLNAMVAADILIIPTQPEYFSAYALRTMMSAIRQVRTAYNPSLSYRILITMYDRRNRIHRDVGEQIRTNFNAGVFQTMIEIDTRLRESAVEGLPISHHSNRSRSALQYDALAQELIEYVQKRTNLTR